MIIERPERPLYDHLGGHQGILKLIRPFYADVRQHGELGPIFNAHIDDWEDHMAKITEFWALQTGGPSRYRGGFAGAHLRIPQLRIRHFSLWLELWDFNCQRMLDPHLAARMSELAHILARRLTRIVDSSHPGHRPSSGDTH